MQQPRDFSLYGAVDLGARQAATQRRQQAARTPTAGASGNGNGEASAFVFDVTEETFNADVATRSRTTPVIVDLWADWCGPCKQLSPVLEKLADEAAGAWVLAKIDVDANPRLAQAFQAQSIPMVVAIVGGQMVDAFLGALPEAQVRQWLTQILAVAEQLGVRPAGSNAGDDPDAASADPMDPMDAMPPAYAHVQAAMERGDIEAAAAALEKALAETPADPVLKSWLSQVNLVRRVSSYDEPAARRDAAARPGDVDAQIKVADIEMAAGQTEDAFQRLLGAVKRTAGEDRNKARLALLDLFDIFPPDDPHVKKARGQLTALLF